MRGRRPGKTGGVFAGIHRGFFRAENDADGCGSFAAVERSMSDRLLNVPVAKWGWRGSEAGWNENNGSILTTLEPVAIMPSGDLAA